jgi:hypothetical protein
MVFRGITLTFAQFLLIIIALVDSYAIPQFIAISWQFLVVVFLVAAVVALCWLSQLSHPTAIGLIFFGLFLPIFSAVFFWMSMIPVCIIRFRNPPPPGKGAVDITKGIVVVTLLAGSSIASTCLEVFGNAPICVGTAGIMTGPSISLLFLAFYRVFVQVWYSILKPHEVNDGLPVRPKKLEAESSSEQYRALPLEFSDYSYGYTYSSEPDDI